MTERVLTVCGKMHSKSNISKHKKTCKKCTSIKKGNTTCFVPNSTYTQQQHEILQLRLELDILKREPRIIHQSQTTNTYVNIASFSSDFQLSTEEVQSLLQPPDQSVPKYVKMKHFEKGGGNIRIPNINSNLIQIYLDGKWLYKDRKEVVSTLKHTTLNELTKRYSALEDLEFKRWFISYHTSDSKEKKELNKRLEMEILNSQR